MSDAHESQMSHHVVVGILPQAFENTVGKFQEMPSVSVVSVFQRTIRHLPLLCLFQIRMRVRGKKASNPRMWLSTALILPSPFVG